MLIQGSGHTLAALRRDRTLQVVNRYIDQGIAELVPGVLFIDEVGSQPDLGAKLLLGNHAPYRDHLRSVLTLS